MFLKLMFERSLILRLITGVLDTQVKILKVYSKVSPRLAFVSTFIIYHIDT